MARYAFAFDLDNTKMKDDNVSDSTKTYIYQTELKNALKKCGFSVHAQGSLYHTDEDVDPIRAIMSLEKTLKEDSPNFCKYVKVAHVFRMEEWSDVTTIIKTE